MNKYKKTVSLIAIMMLISVPMALAGPTELNFDWDGYGVIDIDFTADDDAVMSFYSNGWTEGTLYAKDSDDNPYGYGVDTFDAELEGKVTDGGYLRFAVDRTDSTGMYGLADQSTLTWVGTDETAELNFRTRTNFANLRSSNYGWHSNDHLLATGSYELFHGVINGANWASLHGVGDGTADIDHMADDTWVNDIEFGYGDGCYTNADASFTGVGVFTLDAQFEHSMTAGAGLGGWSVSGPVIWSQSWNFGSGFSIGDYSFSGN